MIVSPFFTAPMICALSGKSKVIKLTVALYTYSSIFLEKAMMVC